MKLSTIQGLIDRRILVNYRLDPKVAEQLLPAPFRPMKINGFTLAGICLIRLSDIRTPLMPSFLGLQSENAAHRIAVEWDQDGTRHTGVYVPRRDTSSRFNSMLGGRLVPGQQHHARFHVHEHDSRYRVVMNSDDHAAHVKVEGRVAMNWFRDSIFPSLDAANQFFACGSAGYSATCEPRRFDGLECQIRHWDASPFQIESVESSWLDDRKKFPDGSLQFDCALLMRNIPHQWNRLQPIRVAHE